MSTIPYGPDWYFRSSHDRLIVWTVDAEGDPVTAEGTVDTRMVRPLQFEPTTETEVTGLGTVREVARAHVLAPEIASGPDVGRLRAWKADGANIVARLLSGGRGRHVMWDEPVPIRLTPLSPGRPSLEGDRLTMESHLFDPAINVHPDLLDGATWEAATGDEETTTVTLPAPALRVHAFFPAPYDEGGAHLAGDITIEALAADGTTVLGTDADALPTLVLPAGTWFVRVTAEPVGTVYPVLTVYAASPAFGDGGYYIVSQDEDTITLGAFGRATIDEVARTITYRGTDYDAPYYAFGPDDIAAARVTDNGDGTVTVTTSPS